jgi:hypothetical protein
MRCDEEPADSRNYFFTTARTLLSILRLSQVRLPPTALLNPPAPQPNLPSSVGSSPFNCPSSPCPFPSITLLV